MLCFFTSSNQIEVPCIPIMSIGIVGDTMNFFPRLIHSIDHCIDNLVVMRSMKSGTSVDHAVSVIRSKPQIFKNLTLIESSHNIFSASEGWNAGLKIFPESKWFLICAYDVEFLPRQLRRFTRRFFNDTGIYPASNLVKNNFVFSNWQNLLPGGYNLFAFTNQVFKALGYFDQNFFPAFYEDDDYHRRAMIWGKQTNLLKWQTYMFMKPFHGTYIRQNYNITNTLSSDKVGSNRTNKGNLHSENYAKQYISGTIYLDKVSMGRYTQMYKSILICFVS